MGRQCSGAGIVAVARQIAEIVAAAAANPDAVGNSESTEAVVVGCIDVAVGMNSVQTPVVVAVALVLN